MKYAILFLVVILTASAADKIPPLTEVRLRSGRVIHQVEFKSFSAESVMAKFLEGAGTIRYDQLPVDVFVKIKDRIPPPPTAEQAAATSAVRGQKLKNEAERERTAALIRQRKITFGMTREDVTRAWGTPQRKNTTANESRTSEQWVYGDTDTYVYFTDGQVTSWQGSQ